MKFSLEDPEKAEFPLYKPLFPQGRMRIFSTIMAFFQRGTASFQRENRTFPVILAFFPLGLDSFWTPDTQ
jgi:hypothetical protein